jgi:hypothetical protein
MHATLFGLRPNKSETIRQKNLKNYKFYHVGLLIILLNFCQSCKTYHFLVKSILKNFSMKNAPTCHQTRFRDALARISAIYKYAVLHVIGNGDEILRGFNSVRGHFSSLLHSASTPVFSANL